MCYLKNNLPRLQSDGIHVYAQLLMGNTVYRVLVYDKVSRVCNAVWRKRSSRQAHNLKIVGSNPTAAIKVRLFTM